MIAMWQTGETEGCGWAEGKQPWLRKQPASATTKKPVASWRLAPPYQLYLEVMGLRFRGFFLSCVIDKLP
jgi:hypothetical protein